MTATLGNFTAECVVTFSPSTDLQDVTATEEGTHKILQNGQVKIVHEGEQYSIKGEKL